MKKIILDGTEMTSRKSLHEYLAGTLSFPDYYGKNLDALNDCLREFCNGCELEIKNADIMKKELGSYAHSVLSVFSDVACDGVIDFSIK